MYCKTTTLYSLEQYALFTLGKYPYLPVSLSRCVCVCVCTEERLGSDFFTPAGTTNRQVKEYL